MRDDSKGRGFGRERVATRIVDSGWYNVQIRFESMIGNRMRTIVAQANSCMRAITAFEAGEGIEIRVDAIDVTRFVEPLKRARYGCYTGLLRTISDATKLHLKVLCDKHKRRQ
jgi:hypothetical protein